MARREKGTDKWRADIQVNGKRKTKLCATEEEAKKLEAHYQHQLILSIGMKPVLQPWSH